MRLITFRQSTLWVAGLSAIALSLHASQCYGIGSIVHDETSGGTVLPAIEDLTAPQITVLAVGTSLTAASDWPEQLERAMPDCGDRRLRIERVARSGETSDWGLQALGMRLADRARPAPVLILIEFSGNDASLARGMSLAHSEANHRAMLKLAAARKIPVLLMTMNPAFGRNGWERPGQIAYRHIYRRLSGDGELGSMRPGLIDMTAGWNQLDDATRRRLLPDGLHPTSVGSARVTIPAIAKMLTTLCDRAQPASASASSTWP